MMYREMIKKVDRQELLIAGMLSKEEVQRYKRDGYKNVVSNRHGIPVGK